MDVQLHRVSVVVLDAETVGPLGTAYAKVQPKDPDRTTKILQLCKAIRTFQDLGLHVIVMTHRPTALSGCDSLVILDQGTITAAGPRDDIIRSMMKNGDHLQRTLQRAAS